jgi:hypothetical protein
MRSLAFVLVLIACGGARAVPPHRFAVPLQVGALVTDDAAFVGFARALRADVAAVLAAHPDDIDHLFVLAMLEALDGRWPEAVARLDHIRAVEHDPRKQIMTGLSIRVWADARARGTSFRDALERIVSALPIDVVRDDLAMLRAMGQTFTPATCRQLVDESVGPHVHDATISFDDAQTVTFQRYAAVQLAGVGADIDAVLAAHGIGLP